MTEHPAFAALPVPCNAAFQEHSGAGSEQVHAVFGSGVQCFGPVIYQALCTSMLGKELSTGVVNMGLGEPGPRPSYVPAEVLPVPEGYVPSTIDESAQQQKWGSRIGGEHHGAELWRLYSTHGARAVDDFTHNLMADVSSMEGGLCSNLFQLASGNNGAWGAVCFTCNKGNAIKLANMGRPGSDIFLSFRAHLNSSGHERARNRLELELDGLVAKGMTREEAAMAVFVARQAGSTFKLDAPPPPPTQPIGSEPTGMQLRSSALQSTAPPQPESLQAIIDRECGKGVFIVRLDESFADCTRCRRDKVQTINLSNPNWIRNAQAHANTHPNISGMRALESYGIAPTSIPTPPGFAWATSSPRSTASRRPAAPLASCCLLQRRRRLGCGSSECRWLSPTIYTSLTY